MHELSRITLTLVCLSLCGIAFLLGASYSHLTKFTIEDKIPIFDALTFFAILTFGFWFQDSQRKLSLKTDAINNLLENISHETCTYADSILNKIESAQNNTLTDDEKKSIHLTFKRISTNIDFIFKKTNKNQKIIDGFSKLKDQVISIDFPTQSFSITTAYIKDSITAGTNLKNLIREEICTFIQSQN